MCLHILYSKSVNKSTVKITNALYWQPANYIENTHQEATSTLVLKRCWRTFYSSSCARVSSYCAIDSAEASGSTLSSYGWNSDSDSSEFAVWYTDEPQEDSVSDQETEEQLYADETDIILRDTQPFILVVCFPSRCSVKTMTSQALVTDQGQRWQIFNGGR